jgi:hypothetical protein
MRDSCRTDSIVADIATASFVLVRGLPWCLAVVMQAGVEYFF